MVIETERLLLRKPILEDFQAYWLMKNDQMATRYTGGVTPYPYQQRLELYEKEWVLANQNIEFSIAIKSSGEYIGYCGFIDENELLYGIKQSAWGKGHGCEAAAAILSYGFEALHLPRIVATVHPQNIASEKILRKIGMIFDRVADEPGAGLVHKYRLDRSSCLF